MLFQQASYVYSLLILVLVSTYTLFNISLGLTLRSVGEYPKAANMVGISVQRVRYFAVVISGCLAALGGAYLTLVQVKYFAEGISALKFSCHSSLNFCQMTPPKNWVSLLFSATLCHSYACPCGINW